MTTFAINVSGAFLLGVAPRMARAPPELDHWARFFVGVGVLGAFTTFSTFATEIVVLARDGHGATAAVYAVTLGRRRARGGPRGTRDRRLAPTSRARGG